MLPVVNAVWIGPELGEIQAACLQSFVRHGHRVILHCYETPKDAPAYIEIADARRFLAEDRILRHRKTGSLALHADLLRYEILGAGLGLYVDCDVFCLRPIEDADYIFGWEGPRLLNTGILKLPPDCPVLAELQGIKDSPTFEPPWAVKRQKGRRRFEWLRGPAPAKRLEDLQWAEIGPRAFTYYAKKHGIDRLASPTDRFYPVHWGQVQLLFDPELPISQLTTHRTDALHLFYSSFWQLPEGLGIPRGSAIWEIVESVRPKSCVESRVANQARARA
jgi:hypothetical protein